MNNNQSHKIQYSKIGIFDSGLGGLIVLRNIRALLPRYDYVFFGDQAHVPYGEKSKDELLAYSKDALKFLFEKENCKAVILACNTTSSNIHEELRSWVNDNYKGRYVWGIVKPTVEMVPKGSYPAFFGTTRTIESHIYRNSVKDIVIDSYEKALPLLAGMIENGQDTSDYLTNELSSVPKDMNTIVLVCTHYGIVAEEFRKLLPSAQNLICQEDILPKYLSDFFVNKPDFVKDLSVNGTTKFFVSAKSPVFDRFLEKWFPGMKSMEI